MSHVPADWNFSRSTIYDLWQQWWIGNQEVMQIHSLMTIKYKYVKLLNEVPVVDEEIIGGTCAKKASQRAVRKMLCDMTFLLWWVSYKKVKEVEAKEDKLTMSSVDECFKQWHYFSQGICDGQRKWISVVNTLDKKSDIFLMVLIGEYATGNGSSFLRRIFCMFACRCYCSAISPS